MTTVFHRGEILIQTESGVDQRAHKMGNKLIRDHIIEQHKEFFETEQNSYQYSRYLSSTTND